MKPHAVDSQSPEMPAVARRERLARVKRVVRPKVWRSIVFGLTEPENDWHWDFVLKRDTDAYLSAPTPWLAAGAVGVLDKRLSGSDHVFEWGSGASTLWFMTRVATVKSFETDRGWVELLAPRLNGRCDVQLADTDEAYSQPDLSDVDVVLIDGMRRSDCAAHVAATGREGLLVVFDDSERDAHLQGAELLSRRASEQWHYPALTAMMTPNLTSIYVLGAQS